MVRYFLTKSRFIRGLQCPKALYLDTFHRDWAIIDEPTRLKFIGGRLFEKSFKDTFPGAVDVSSQMGKHFGQYPEVTAKLLDSQQSISLFEAGFLYNGVLVLADVLSRDESGSISIFEVKNSSLPKEVFFLDVAIQYYVISHCVSNITHFYLVHHDAEGNFVRLDLLPDARRRLPFVEEQVNSMKSILQGLEPSVEMGPQCDNPYPCPFRNHCTHPSGQLEL